MNTTHQAKELLLALIETVYSQSGRPTKATAKKTMKFVSADKELNSAVNIGGSLSGFDLKTCDWNSVHDILPPKGDFKCFSDNCSVHVDVVANGVRWVNCYYCFNDKGWFNSTLGSFIQDVTHWMPVPELPKEQ